MNSESVMFENFSRDSRVWIYQSNVPIADDIQINMLQLLNEQLVSWKSHGLPLKAVAEVFFGRFVVIALDESVNSASGCSIDASTKWLKAFGEDFGIDFFDRSLVYVKEGIFKSISLQEIKNNITSNDIQKNTIVFDNAIQKLNQMQSHWIIRAENSWLKRYFE